MSSDNDIVLSVRNVSKCFEMYEKPVHRRCQTLCVTADLRRKFSTSSWGGARYAPHAFIEQGDYSIVAAIASGTQREHVQHHWVNEALISKSAKSHALGLVGLNDVVVKMEVCDEQA